MPRSRPVMALSGPSPRAFDEARLVRSAGDFYWLFQDWKTRVDENDKVNERVGVAIPRVEVVHGPRGRKTEDSGEVFVAKRLSVLGGPSQTTRAARELMAFNLGLPRSVLEDKSQFPGPLYQDDSSLNIVGLGGRVRKSGLFGDLNPQQVNQLMRDVFGIDPEGDLGKALLGDGFDALGDAQEHVERITRFIEEQAEEAIDNFIAPGLREEYSIQLESWNERMEEAYENLLDITAEALPRVTPENQRCQ